MKPGYKQTEVGIIPDDWEVKPLSAVSSMKSGEAITASRIDQHSQYPCYGGNGLRGFTSRYTHDGAFALIGRQGALCGNVVGVSGKLFASEHAVVVTPRQGTHIQFLTYVLGEMHLNRLSEASAQPGLSVSKILQLSIGAPPTETEQRAIVEALSDVDGLLGGLDRLIAKKRDLKQAAMQQLLTGQTRLPGFHGEWEVKRLGELGSIYGGLTGKTKTDFGEGSAHYITFMNVMTNVVINCATFERVQVSPMESQNRGKKGDLFFNGSSETPEEVAMCAVLLDEVRDVYLNSFCFGFRFHGGAEADGLFLAYYLRSKEGRELMKSLAQGSTRYNLSKAALLKSPLHIPKLHEQTAIATVLSEMDGELAVLEQRREKTRALKQAMMQELLTGRTRLV
jgi:type I restriction enzyme S subunit